MLMILHLHFLLNVSGRLFYVKAYKSLSLFIIAITPFHECFIIHLTGLLLMDLEAVSNLLLTNNAAVTIYVCNFAVGRYGEVEFSAQSEVYFEFCKIFANGASVQ